MSEKSAHRKARLMARPHDRPESHEGPADAGTQPLNLSARRDALLHVPASYKPGKRTPLVVSLHGAGGNERHGIDLLRSQSELFGFLLLAPASRESTWDIILGRYGVDVEFLDHALQRTFALCNVDPMRVGISGFSDGASYALCLGLPNGDLFTDILAFSPGFTAHPSTLGKPRIFVSHGTQDRVLPIQQCSRRIVPKLRSAGYHVRYREFDGPHTVPTLMAEAATRQFVLSGQDLPR